MKPYYKVLELQLPLRMPGRGQHLPALTSKWFSASSSWIAGHVRPADAGMSQPFHAEHGLCSENRTTYTRSPAGTMAARAGETSSVANSGVLVTMKLPSASRED